LFVARTLVAGITALGLGVAFAFAFKIGAGHVVEQKLEAHAEPLAVAFHQVGAEAVLVVFGEPVETTVEPVVVDLGGVEAKQVVERGGVESLFGHAQFGGLSAEARDG
jgi:hypothetical protein